MAGKYGDGPPALSQMGIKQWPRPSPDKGSGTAKRREKKRLNNHSTFRRPMARAVTNNATLASRRTKGRRSDLAERLAEDNGWITFWRLNACK